MRPRHPLFYTGGALVALALAAPGLASAQSNPKNTFNILMNYELGMHCTGFEFAYCCVLPPYNSILAQVVKTQRADSGQGAFARLLEGDPNVGLDPLGRETVLRDPDLSGNNFQKYVLRYWHEAQPRNDGRGKPQSSTLISAVEGNSLFMWNTVYDAAAKNANGSLKTGSYNGASGVVRGDGDYQDAADSYANGWMNHLYIYSGLEGDNPGNTSLESQKIRLGVDLVVPVDCGPAFHPMGPDTENGNPANPTTANTCGGFSNGNVLTFSGDKGTIVYTQMKVLENLPVTLTSPRIWEALGLPLTPFEDSINFFGDPGLVDEDSIRPYVKMRAQLHRFDPTDTSATDGDAKGVGAAVLVNSQPVIGLGTAPIDIPNCERCHSNAPTDPNSPQKAAANRPHRATQWTLVQQEYNYWKAYYNLDPAAGDSDWYARLKSAAISMLYDHDAQHGTSFADNYPATGDLLGLPASKAAFPQNTRLGHESVICQKCHADNVIAVVKSATGSNGLIRPISEAVHRNHRNVTELDAAGEPGVIAFSDSLGRDGGCQGCHPAHRSNGDMAGYPITLNGANFYANGDNRLASGGCFVGRDVHSNPNKDVDGAGTPEHLTAVGQWLKDNVSRNQGGLAGDPRSVRGIWCTNCHTQLSQEIWKKEDCNDLIHGNCVSNPRAATSLSALATTLGISTSKLTSWLDPKTTGSADGFDRTHDIWREAGSDPATQDANVATIEVDAGGNPVVTTDADGDVSVNILSFCTTTDCVNRINANKTNPAAWRYPVNPFRFPATSTAVAVPFSAATDGRDHWLSAGEPHCADCHAAPYTEQSGNINAFAPFNYPAKAGLMRYSRGHRDITCQGCHESTHGLYPVTASIDTTTYAQAAGLNSDGSHGPLKCGSCHRYSTLSGGGQIPTRVRDGLRYQGQSIKTNFDLAVGWAHTFTEEHDPRNDYCLNCHGDERNEVRATEKEWLEHAEKGRASRETMDQVEILTAGAVFGTTNPRTTVCQGCHSDKWSKVSCSNTKWKQHLTLGRVSEAVWESVSRTRTGTPAGQPVCGW